MSSSGEQFVDIHLSELSPALSVPAAPASGVDQPNNSGGVQVVQLFADGGASAGTVQMAIGPNANPAAVGPAITVPISTEVSLPLLIVPKGWHWSVTTGGTAAPTLVAGYMLQF